MLSLRMGVNDHTLTFAFANILHIKEAVEERIDKLRGHYHKLRKLLFQSRVKLVIFLRCNLKILLQLPSQSARIIGHI